MVKRGNFRFNLFQKGMVFVSYLKKQRNLYIINVNKRSFFANHETLDIISSYKFREDWILG